MKRFVGLDGRAGWIVRLQGPMIVNTPEGEFCAEAGHVVVHYDSGKPIVLTEEMFYTQFKELTA